MADGSDDDQAMGLLSALRMGGEPSLDASSVSDVDEIPQALKVTSPEDDITANDGADGKEQSEKDASEGKTTLDDFIEIEAEDGAEPEKIAVKDAVEGYKQWEQFKGQQAEIVHRVETQAVQQADKMVRQHYDRITGVEDQLAAVLQVIKPPEMPSQALRDPNSPYYNPEQYNAQRDQFDQAMVKYREVQETAQELRQYRTGQQAREAQAREARQLQELAKAWPEWSDPAKGEATQRAVANGVYKHYGLTFADVDKLDKAGFFFAMKDALAFRDMKSSAPQTKKTIEAKAAKVVKTNGASAQSSQTARRQNGQFAASDALTRLRKSHSDADAVNFFEGHFAKQSRPG